MFRTLLFSALALPAFAATLEDVNRGERKAANDAVKAEQDLCDDHDRTSMDAELRNQLGDDWTVKKSGNGFLVSRVTHAPADPTHNLHHQLRDFRSHNKDAQAIRRDDEIVLRGVIDDCGDAAEAAHQFAGIDGVNRIFVDLSCANR